MSNVSVDTQNAFTPLIAALNYPVAWPNVEFKPTANYLRVNYLNSRSETHTLGSDRLPSTLQITVVIKDGIGAIKGAEMVDSIRSAFPKGLVITENNTTIRIDREPYESPAINQGGWFYIPVSIPYEVYL